MVAIAWICNKTPPKKVDKVFRRLQLVSAAAYSIGHGGNDAQKTIGIIWMLLVAAGLSQPDESVPVWVIASCYAAMGLGTMFGGWRIVRTMGQRITKLNQAKGFSASMGGAITLFMSTVLGIPVSTTHTITGAIAGVGSTGGPKNVRWGVAGGIVWAWILTIPPAGSSPPVLVDRPPGVVSPCQSCGACCASYRVSFPCHEVDDLPGGSVPAALVEDDRLRIWSACAAREAHRCVASPCAARGGIRFLCDLRVPLVGMP
jgi:hypothetical protein